MNHRAHEIPDSFLRKWQDTTNVMASIFEVPAGLIMRVRPEQIEVLVSSHTPDNPYEADEKAQLCTGLYCETVMASRDMLCVPNALQDEKWKNNPDVALNMISYLGVPLLWTDEEVFGTICVLDSKTRRYRSRYVDLLWELKKSIEADFKVIQQQTRLIASNVELRDAIERQRADAQALQTMQADLLRSEKMAALGSLVVGVAHELNTPIGNCLMVASTLQGQGAQFAQALELGLTRGGAAAFAQTVNQGAEILMRGLGHAGELVGRFKQLAVDQSGLERRRFALSDAMLDLRTALGGQLGQARLESAIPPDLTLDSYPSQLQQVLANLVSNAVLHGFAGRSPGTVTVTAAALPDQRLRLDVRDDGVGIAREHLGRVFDPFFTTRLGHGGSGLGLHVAYNLVHTVLGGTIEVSSEPGRGACFTLCLPLAAPLPAPQAAPLAGAGSTVH